MFDVLQSHALSDIDELQTQADAWSNTQGVDPELECLGSEENPENLELSETCNVDVDFENHLEHINNFSDTKSDSESDSDQFEESLHDELRHWAVKHQVPNVVTSDLLLILRKRYPFVPKDPRTLLKTMVNYDTSFKCGGQYYHFGISSAVNQQRNAYSLIDTLPDQFCLKIQININGLPLFKSASDQFWPILGMISNLEIKKPFVIGLYYGLSKPDNVSQYLEDFINEILKISRNGIQCSDKIVQLSIDSVICDTPARAFVKCIKSFSGYRGCDKCSQNGTWLGKMTYPETNAHRYTDESFANRPDEDHHKGISPLSQIHLGMVSQIPLDYVHLVCLGVVKRLLLLWMKGP